MDIWALLDIVCSVIAGLVLLWVWYAHFKHHSTRRVWKCYRFQGGGVLVSPKRMTLSEVTLWLGRSVGAEVASVDELYGFIFYRPKGGG